MKYSFLSAGLMMMGLFGLVFIVMFETVTINNESSYYNLREAMKASMLESVDLDCYRDSTEKGCQGTLKISEQKFVENFTRRFAASTSGDVSEYKLEFHDIIEKPPKATVIIMAKTGNELSKLDQENKTSSSFEIVNQLTGILEGNDWQYYLENSNSS